MLARSIYLLFVPVFLFLALLACAETALTATPAFTCPTATALPTVLPGTATPSPGSLPSPTPYTITAPDDFYLGDWVTVGRAGEALAVRFRLTDVETFASARDDQSAYTWTLDVENIGVSDYEIYPALQIALTEIDVFDVVETGTWWPSTDAADEAGVTLDGDVYTLAPSEHGRYQLAAHAPAGEAKQFSLTLDDAGNVLTWTTAPNPYC